RAAPDPHPPAAPRSASAARRASPRASRGRPPASDSSPPPRRRSSDTRHAARTAARSLARFPHPPPSRRSRATAGSPDRSPDGLPRPPPSGSPRTTARGPARSRSPKPRGRDGPPAANSPDPSVEAPAALGSGAAPAACRSSRPPRRAFSHEDARAERFLLRLSAGDQRAPARQSGRPGQQARQERREDVEEREPPVALDGHLQRLVVEGGVGREPAQHP